MVTRAASGGGGGGLRLITGGIGSSTGRVMFSDDTGSTWDDTVYTATPLVAQVDAIVLAGDRLYLRYTSGTNRVYTSTDGTTWTVCTGVETGFLSSACKVGSRYVLSFVNSYRISTDGINFVEETTQVGSNYGCAAIGDVAVVSSTLSNYKLTTNGGVTWTTPVAGVSAAYAAASATTFALVASNLCRRSSTGLAGSWSSSTITGMGTCDGIASDGDSTFVAIDTTGKIFYSINNGSSWTASTDIGIAGFNTGVTSDRVGAVFYAGGSWLATLYNSTSGVAKIFKSDSPSGPFTETHSWTNNIPLAGIQPVPA